MATKKDLLGNELMREVARIRIDTLWNMVALHLRGRLPPIDAEKATGDFDDKGALFVPGGFVLQDWEGNSIVPVPYEDRTPDSFRKTVREAMRHDGAHLMFHEGMAASVKLGNTSFAKVAASILENKKEARRRRTGAGERRPARLASADISRSYCPTHMSSPYGSRTSLSSDLSACFTEPRMYLLHTEAYFSMRREEADRLWSGIKASRQPVIGKGDVVLAPPMLVTCHSTRYREEVYVGLTRISGYGKFGEFATLTLEQATTELLHELDGNRTQWNPEDFVAEQKEMQAVCVLRTYPATNPGARLLKGVTAALVSVEKDLGIDLAAVTAEARKRYGV